MLKYIKVKSVDNISYTASECVRRLLVVVAVVVVAVVAFEGVFYNGLRDSLITVLFVRMAVRVCLSTGSGGAAGSGSCLDR